GAATPAKRALFATRRKLHEVSPPSPLDTRVLIRGRRSHPVRGGEAGRAVGGRSRTVTAVLLPQLRPQQRGRTAGPLRARLAGTPLRGRSEQGGARTRPASARDRARTLRRAHPGRRIMA